MLQLYPYFIPYEDDTDAVEPGIQADAGLLDTFTETRINYLAAVLWKIFTRTDDELLAFFNFYFFKRLARSVKVKKTHPLTWGLVKEFFLDISANRMGTAVEKYNSKLYLERESLKAVFRDFLASPKTCLVITGKSGVGKSNFLVSMEMNLRPDPQYSVLLLNGARLPKGFSLENLVNQEFNERLSGDINSWNELNRILENTDRKVLIFIDALNENPDAYQVLRSIDQQIEKNIHPWLKIVITSRPETWKAISLLAKLTIHKYYWQDEKTEMGVTLEEFAPHDPYSLKPFYRDELEHVYQKYKQVYHLKTEYVDITSEIKQELCDPLMLLLVSSTYGSKDGSKTGIIPATLSVAKIYDQYVDALKVSGRLLDADLNFLQNDIVPRLLSGTPKPLLTQDDFLVDERFREKIFSEDLFSGRPINASFVRLVDAEILASLPVNGPASVGFKYERFYDHFVGGFFFEKYLQVDNKLETIKDLVAQIKDFPFLWGGVRNALFKELETGPEGLIDMLASEQDQAVRELVISVLTEMGREPNGKARVDTIAQRLLKLDRQTLGIISSVRVKLTGTDSQPLTPSARSASKTALEVARRLGLSSVSRRAVLDPSPSVRIFAARNIYHLWRDNPKEGYAIFDSIVNQATDRSGLPNVPAVEVSFALAILLLRHYYPETLEGRELGVHVAREMQKITKRLFFVNTDSGLWKRLVIPVARDFIVNAVIRFVVKTQESYPKDKPSFLNEVGDLVKSPAEIKARYNRLLDYFENPTRLSRIRDDLEKATEYNDTLTNGLIWLLLIFEFISNRETDSSILEELADLELRQPVVGSANEGMIIALGLIAFYKKDTSDETFHRLERMTIKYIERTRGIYFSRSGTRHPNLALNPYMTLRRFRQNSQDPDLLAIFLQRAIQEKDWSFGTMLLDVPVNQVSVSDDLLNVRMALQSLKAVFPIPLEMEDKVIFTLSRIRLYNREEVDNFLMEVDAEKKILPKVLRAEPDEQVWSELFHNIYSTILVRLLQTPEIKQDLALILRQATRQKNLNTYLKWAVKELMNLLTGEAVFQVGQR